MEQLPNDTETSPATNLAVTAPSVDTAAGSKATGEGPTLMEAPANPEATVVVGNARFTILADGLIRMEHSKSSSFRNCATQVVVNRDFPVPNYTVSTVDGVTEIRTANLRVRYAGGPFTPSSLNVNMRVAAQGAHYTTWHYEEPTDQMLPTDGNFGGTVRTLDEIDGEIPLEPGLISRAGYSVLNDTESLPMTADGWVTENDSDEVDLYFFGFGSDHHATLRAFFHLTGESPLLPRKALGNWWSRYHAYSAEEYIGLMDHFEEDKLPFSVAVIDMDWHLVNIDPSLGTGWTGYTWNKDLFPDPAEFLENLKTRGMLTTLNVHPADGVRRHEDAYEDVARALDIDPTKGDEVAFDIAREDFAEAYFKYLHHPHEEKGVDFWWVDWQSGDTSRIDGLDPLWMLNYLHYEDTAREGRRPLTFSRYAGIGSHRYPIGFSGDTIITWDSLRFQPKFTAAAANVGYYWWSNDIGGHMFGVKDNELQTRWVQFGVFSPVMRLHSTFGPFGSKEPRNYGPEAARVQGEFLRLRHALVPYLYSAMWNSNEDGVAPVRPMYHDWPGDGEYTFDQYMFGPSMTVAPIIEPLDPKTGLGSVSVWLPEGDWVDFFSGQTYFGHGSVDPIRSGLGSTNGRLVQMFRPLDTIPVLVKAGHTVPLAGEVLGPIEDHPEHLNFRMFPVSQGSGDASEMFTGTVVEDDGALHPVKTEIRHETTWKGDTATLTLEMSGDDKTGRPRRKITVGIADRSGFEEVKVNGKTVVAEAARTPWGVEVDLGELDLAAGATVEVLGLSTDAGKESERVYALLNAAQGPNMDREKAWASYQRAAGQGNAAKALATIQALDLPDSLKGALTEVLTA